MPALLSLLLLMSASRADFLEGLWKGAMVVDGAVSLIELDVQREGLNFNSFFSFEDGNILKRPVTLELKGDDVSFPLFGGRLSLRIDAEYHELRGVFPLGDNEARVHLVRSRRPGSLVVETEEVTFPSEDGVKLAGTLALPKGEGPFAGLVLLSGRGYGSRNSGLLLANHLASHGVATLSFDGRGRGRSEGVHETLTIEQRIGDALAALSLLDARPSIDGERLGLMGTSAGAWVAAHTLPRTDLVSYLIFEVGPVEDVPDQQASVTRYRMLWSGEDFSEEEIEEAANYNRLVFRTIAAQEGWDDLAPHIENARQQRWSNFVTLPTNLNEPRLSFFFRQAYDPVPFLAELDVPLLAVYGDRDFVVPPQANVPKLHRLMEEAGNEDYEAVVYPGVGHGLTLEGGIRGEGEEWLGRHFVWQRIYPGFVNKLTSWVLEHTEED